MRVNYIMDNGHGWLAVSLSDFPDAEAFGTGFGYIDRRAGIVYLEHDVEAGAFMRAHPDTEMVPVVVSGDAPLRCFPRNEAYFDPKTEWMKA